MNPPSTGAPDLEVMAEAVHEAYLTTCKKLGWDVKPANQVPYSALTEDSKELDRASVRAVLAALPLQPAGDLREAAQELLQVWDIWQASEDVELDEHGMMMQHAAVVDAANAVRALLGGGKGEGNLDVPPPKTGAVPSGQGVEAALSRFPTMPPEDPDATYYLPMYEGRGSICRYCRKVLSEHYDMLCPIRGCTLQGPPESPSTATRSTEGAEGTNNGN